MRQDFTSVNIEFLFSQIYAFTSAKVQESFKSLNFSTFSSCLTKTSTFFLAIGFNHSFSRSGGKEVIGASRFRVFCIPIYVSLLFEWIRIHLIDVCIFLWFSSFPFLYSFFFFWSGLIYGNRNSWGSESFFWNVFFLHSTSTFS